MVMFQTRCEYSKHVSNALLIFKTRFKCFERVGNIQKTLLIFPTRCEYSKHISNISNALLIFKYVLNVSNALQIFKTLC